MSRVEAGDRVEGLWGCKHERLGFHSSRVTFADHIDTGRRFIYNIFAVYLLNDITNQITQTQHSGWSHSRHKSITIIWKRRKNSLSNFPSRSYNCISPVIKSQRVQNVPNRQLHATTKASKSFPDRSTLDQGEREARREETEAKIN